MNKLTLPGDDVNGSPVENLLEHLNKRLPQKRIADYLGITEVHFTNLKVKRLRR